MIYITKTKAYIKKLIKKNLIFKKYTKNVVCIKRVKQFTIVLKK